MEGPRRHETRSEELFTLLQALLVAVSDARNVCVHWGSAGRAMRKSAALIAALVLKLGACERRICCVVVAKDSKSADLLLRFRRLHAFCLLVRGGSFGFRLGSFYRLSEHESVVDLATEPALILVHDGVELLLVISRQVALLQDSHVALHIKYRLVMSDLWSMNRSHARLFLEDMDNSFFLVGTRPDSLRCSVDHILVDRTLVETLILAKSALVGLRLLWPLVAIKAASFVSFLRVVGAGSFLFGVTETELSSSHFFTDSNQNFILI